jgi:phosphoglycolate phosphatase-like HAD superfamily hydrolase
MRSTGAIIFDMDGVLTDSEWFIAIDYFPTRIPRA